MEPTPSHDGYNPDLLALMDRRYTQVVEIGCSRGGLARMYRERYPDCAYIGLDIDPENVEVAKRFCTRALCADVEALNSASWNSLFPSDCWVFGDTLEHLRDPWSLLRRVRQSIDSNGEILACIPNVQHWSIQARIAAGAFRYEEQGLLDKTHLRWFTRVTLSELFEGSGFTIVGLFPRVFAEKGKERFLSAIRAFASEAGFDPELATRDALPLQYVVRAVPSK